MRTLLGHFDQRCPYVRGDLILGGELLLEKQLAIATALSKMDSINLSASETNKPHACTKWCCLILGITCSYVQWSLLNKDTLGTFRPKVSLRQRWLNFRIWIALRKAACKQTRCSYTCSYSEACEIRTPLWQGKTSLLHRTRLGHWGEGVPVFFKYP
jgi:hypothetical protein